MNERSGMTLIDALVLLVVGGTTSVLVIHYLCFTPRHRGVDNNDQKANLKNLAWACRTAEVENGHLPPAFGRYGRPPLGNEKQQRTASTFVHLLPYLESKALFDLGEFDKATLRVFQSSMDSSLPNNPGYTSFVANLRAFSTHGAAAKWNEPVDTLEKCLDTALTTEKFLDGAGNTVLFTTKYAVCNGVHNRYFLPPWDASNGGPYFGAGSHAGGPLPTQDVPGAQRTMLPAYQVAPTLAVDGRGVCNNGRGLFGHSFGGSGLAIVMADSSVRNLSFQVSGDTFAKAICPNDGHALGNDW